MQSLGSLVIQDAIVVLTAHGTYSERTIEVETNIVRGPIPCLISRECLPRVGAILDFQSLKLSTPPIGEAQLRLRAANHFCLPRIPIGKPVEIEKYGILLRIRIDNCIFSAPTESIQVNVAADGRTLSQAEIIKLHIHLGHANKLALVRAMKAEKIKVAMTTIDDVIEACPCEITRRDRIQPPAVGRHRVLWAGHTAMADLWYPVAEDDRKFPYMIAVAKFSRFAVTGFLGNIAVLETIEFFNSRRLTLFGRPIRLIMDKEPGLVGEQWEAYTSVCNIAWISNPTEAPPQG